MKIFGSYVVVPVLTGLALSACIGSSSGVVGPQGDAYVVHRANSIETHHLLYKTDGTVGGTVLVYTPTVGADESAKLDGIETLGNFVYFNQFKNDEAAGFLPNAIRTFHKVDTSNGDLVSQEPHLVSQQPLGDLGVIRSLKVGSDLYVYSTSLDNGSQGTMGLELIRYDTSGNATDLSPFVNAQDMFWGEAVAIGSKIFFISAAGFIGFETIGTPSPAIEVSLPSGYRSVKLGQEAGKLFIAAGDPSNPSGDTKLYGFDPSSFSNPVVEVGTTYFSNLDGGKISNAEGYFLGSNDTNLIVRNISSEVETTLLPCICLLYTSPSPRDGLLSRMPSSA